MARRVFLKTAVLAALGAVGGDVSAAVRSPRRGRNGDERRLSFYNTHTSESVDAVYWIAGAYVPAGLRMIDRVLRDHRTGAVHVMDRRLLDLLFTLRSTLETAKPFHIISGFRSPESNAYLRGLSPASGVAKQSQHMLGRAIDIRVPGVALDRLRAAALAMQKGGVGFYPESNFVHVDVGRVRRW